VLQADAADDRRMKSIKAEAEEKIRPDKWGDSLCRVPGGGVMQLKTREAAEKVLRPKVLAPWFWTGLFKNQPLDFFVAFFLYQFRDPHRGQVDYCAANAFLDAYAWYKNSPG